MRTIGLVTLALLLPICATATALININTADAELLDTLPGIGPTKAAAIVDYRTLNGPFARAADIQNVSGIGPSTYADIESLITVGDAGTAPPPASSAPASGEATVSVPYTPPPSSLSVDVSGSRNAILEVPLRLLARVTSKGGAVDPSAQISWSFGDGSSAIGTAVEKLYRYAGTYLVVVTATDGSATARDELIVRVVPAQVRLLPVTGDGITIVNDSSERLDLSGWRLVADFSSFRIPDGMTILPEASVLLPFAITNLPVALDTALRYPSGIVAARAPVLSPAVQADTAPAPAVGTVVQPSEPARGFNGVQTVEKIISTKSDIQSYEEAVRAPAAATELAAAGAALPALEPASTVSTRSSSLFRSPWTLSFIGLMTLAAGAFIFL